MSIIQEFDKASLPKLPKFPELRPGFTIKVHQRIKEGKKERTQIFEGMVIRRHMTTRTSGTITVRRIATGGIGVERVFPLASPTIEKIEVMKKAKVRRAFLSYLRGRRGKSARLIEQRVSKADAEVAVSEVAVSEVAVSEVPAAEAPVVEAKGE